MYELNLTENWYKKFFELEEGEYVSAASNFEHPESISNSCQHCSNNKNNGGSGICHCTLGSNIRC